MLRDLLKLVFPLSILLLSMQQTRSQTDTDFWFVAPEITESHGDTGLWLRLTTFLEPAVVTISQPANKANFADIVVSMAPGASHSVKLTDRIAQLENKPSGQVNPYGLHIASTGKITVCYDETSLLNTERFTLKGKNALGTRFFIPGQNYFNNSPSYVPLPYNAFDIVATQDSTRVVIVPSQNLQGGFPAGDTIRVLLMEGQTYSCVAASQNPSFHLAGSVVTSNKPIAITTSDDSLEKNPPFTCADLIGDQIVPIDVLGREYVVVRGYLDNILNDRVYVTSAANSNKIYLNGSLVSTLNAGQMYSFQITSAQKVAYVTSDGPVYVYHVSGYGCELGDALLPTIKCTGSSQIAFTRVTTGEFVMLIVTATGAEDDFVLDGSTTKIQASMFSPVPGTTDPQLVYARIEMPIDTVGIGPHLITNQAAYFSLGIINSTQTGTFSASYGYFSDFSNLNLGPDDWLCPGSPVVLDAGQGIQRSYLWNTGATTQSITVTQPGTYWVTVNESINNCVLTDTIVLTGYDLPVVDVTGDTLKCQGETGNLMATGGPFLSYLWNTGATTPNISFTASGTYRVTVTNEHCSASDSLAVQVIPYAAVSVHIDAVPPGDVCEGTAVTYTATPVNGGPTPTFHWTVNGIASGTDSPVFIHTPLNGDIIRCSLTSSHPCPSGSPALSNEITMVVLPWLTPAISIAGNHGGATICLGTPVTFTATPVNGGTSPVYDWQVNGISQGINNAVFTYSPANQDVVSCIMTSSYQCLVIPAVSSNQITMSVLNNPVSVTISSLNDVCELTPVTFTANPVNGGSSPSYQWQVNGIISGTNDPQFSYSPVDDDVVTCILTSDIICPSGNPATSPPVLMNVLPNAYAGITLTSAPDPVCDGTPVTFTAHPVNGGSNPIYQWQVNGFIAGTNSPVYSYTPAAGDIVTCQITSNYPCPIINQATSPPVNVNPNLPVSITITGDNNLNPVCLGEAVLFTASVINGGTTPSYHWMVNGLPAGPNASSFVYNPSDNDAVHCILTSSAICPTGNPATSNTISLTVIDNPVSVSITASGNNICEGTGVTFTALPVNGGSSPFFQWRINGLPAGSNQDQMFYIPGNGDQVSCELTSNIICPTGNPAVSNPIDMVVLPYLTAGTTVSADQNPVCDGTPVNFTAVPVNGGTAPQYGWFVNGISQGSTGEVFGYTPQDQDEVYCIMTSSYQCPAGNPAFSDTIRVVVHDMPAVSFSACTDVITTTDAQPFILKGGLPAGGTYTGTGVNPASGLFTPQVAGPGTHTITYSYTNVWSCTASATLPIQVLPAPAFTCGQTLTDVRDGKTYPTVSIGPHCWMASNLNYGTRISSTIHQRDNCITEKYCWYDIPAYCNQDGGLYQWEEVMQYAGQENLQGLCPPGWHIPSEAQWKTLFDHFFASPTIENARAAGYLKSTGTSGFNATMDTLLHMNRQWNFDQFFPARYLQGCCPFDSVQHHLHATFFWSSTTAGSEKAWSHGMNNFDPSVSRYASSRSNAFYIRCRKD